MTFWTWQLCPRNGIFFRPHIQTCQLSRIIRDRPGFRFQKKWRKGENKKWKNKNENCCIGELLLRNWRVPVVRFLLTFSFALLSTWCEFHYRNVNAHALYCSIISLTKNLIACAFIHFLEHTFFIRCEWNSRLPEVRVEEFLFTISFYRQIKLNRCFL